MTRLSGGEAVVHAMVREGVKKAFCVPGESYLGVLNALYEHSSIQLITGRHEGGVSFMADAYAKASGEVGVCMATRGPGASNLSIGLHAAMQDSTPLVALIGQVERPFKGREAFQEVDFAAYFSHLCKWTVEIDLVERIPELLHRAFHIARSGRPGPVVVSLPHDMLEDFATFIEHKPYETAPLIPHEESLDEALMEISKSRKPILIVGGGITQSKATKPLIQFAEALGLPVVTSYRRMDAFPNNHPCYAGGLGFGTPANLLDYIRNADLVIAVGTRFSQVTTQDYSLLADNPRLIHVDISSDELGKVYTPTLPILADAKQFLLKAVEKVTEIKNAEREELLNKLHSNYLEFSTTKADYSTDYVDLDGMMHDLIQLLPKDTVITSDSGNFFGWISRYYRFVQENTYIGTTSGSMGYGLPAAIGAKLAHPRKTVISISGDGGYTMTMQELETAVRENIPVVTIVANNNMYGTIRMHQEKQFPDRVVATSLSNPDFAKMAMLVGAHGEQVAKNEDFIPALERALSSGRPAVIEVLTNPKILSAGQRKVSGLKL
ncbi:thiamine pyrophosphate-binding protein [Peribacillus sp. NJ11]|uniref:thiamine pyrophosphate-dependent enzyme n=1 Tax=Peribacillus sp. NJ11 TaxID=3055861 RepID=UPI0025A0EBE0|nr:thiamine pyrophosphate-dependent enzyme [Peribacillus sp. NJ11]MDM5220989.1 thiamine pyrophosphate-binding protein [Peribacillus sp. NJ11]